MVTLAEAVEAHRESMADYLLESLQMIQRQLAEADFGAMFPHIFAKPEDEEPQFSVRDESGLLLKKASIHIVAVLGANKANNLHSMAVHMRIALECAAQIIGKENVAYEGSPEERSAMLNALDYDYYYVLNKVNRGALSHDEVQDIINNARLETGDYNENKPKRVRFTDSAKSLANGEEWYKHFSRHFVHTSTSGLAGPLSTGGVRTMFTEIDLSTFANLLDYFVEHVIRMLFSYGFLLIVENGDNRPAHEAFDLLKRKSETSRAFYGPIQDSEQTKGQNEG